MNNAKVKIALITSRVPPLSTQTYITQEFLAFKAMGANFVVLSGSDLSSIEEKNDYMSDKCKDIDIQYLPDIGKLSKYSTEIINCLNGSSSLENEKFLTEISGNSAAIKWFIGKIANNNIKKKILSALQDYQKISSSESIKEKIGCLFLQGIVAGYIFSQNKINIAYAQNCSKPFIVSHVASILNDCPLYASGHDTDHRDMSKDEIIYRMEKSTLIALEATHLKKQFEDADAKLCKEKVAIIFRGIDLAKFTPQENELRSQNNGKDGVVKLICVGRMAPIKGQDVLIKAIKCIQNIDDSLNFELLLVGAPIKDDISLISKDDSNKFFDNLKSIVEADDYLKKHVKFLGESSNVSSLFQSADINIIPSRQEGLPVVLIESSSLGLPSIVSRNVQCATDIIHENENGLLFDNGDVKGLADKIVSLIKDPDKRLEFSKKISTSCIEKFDYKTSQLPLLEHMLNNCKAMKVSRDL